MSLLGKLPAATFLKDYWQKQPLLIKQALPQFEAPITPDELAGLALEPDIESRIIQTQVGEQPWALRRGPFTEETFAELGEKDWTLLVQAVDHWVPEVAELLKTVSFLPRWRLDDIMISFAATGGSVGPHYDNYDVFLLQAEGTREWQLGGHCDSDTPLLCHSDLQVLEQFSAEQTYTLEPGDVLYLPPQVAHYGIALTPGMTFSIGFRAPAYADMIGMFADFIASELVPEQRYHDPDLGASKEPGKIDDVTIARLRRQLLNIIDQPDKLRQWFGEHMTEPKYSTPPVLAKEQLQPAAITELSNLLHEGYQIVLNLDARLAYSETNQELLVFADGVSVTTLKEALPIVQRLCERHSVTWQHLQSKSEAVLTFLATLWTMETVTIHDDTDGSI
ncbi:cupin domain-containing protein [Endozoicomonas sp. SM1973]|uniref:Cupin domain-containing protein n=1 Tax=Spartinivicinus marinus TaxID=2994442 RepID=A0A853I3Y1_9GAMM|nr:cupin domain-containing protein [Spartinivicinus marinus]MCX4028989.1 cupin domain-containing protein [Spartinivicinus marinus]NYZ65428.1 cupin domain-containing protein [Spartinivicinus marinus]